MALCVCACVSVCVREREEGKGEVTAQGGKFITVLSLLAEAGFSYNRPDPL